MRYRHLQLAKFAAMVFSSLSTLGAAAAHAQSAPVNHFTSSEIATGSCWIDAKTGESVPTGPRGWNPTGASSPTGRFSNPDPSHVYDGGSGSTFVNDPQKGWIDAKTGESVPTGPRGWNPTGASSPTGRFSNPDSNHVYDDGPGRTYVRVPCPPPDATAAQTPPVGSGTPTPPPPERTATYSGLHHNSEVGWYGGVGGQYYTEPGTKVGLINIDAGFRFLPWLGLEGELGIGVASNHSDYGASYSSSTGISWSAMPFVVASLPVAPNVELFGRAGYGIYHFHSTTTVSGTDYTSSSTVGTAAFGGGAQFHIGPGAVRASYTRLQFDNGSGANQFGLGYVVRFGS
jgi:hypothetical protein